MLGVSALTAAVTGCAIAPPSPYNEGVGLNGLVLYTPPAHLNARPSNLNVAFTGLGGVRAFATLSGWNCFNKMGQQKNRDISFFDNRRNGDVRIRVREDDFPSRLGTEHFAGYNNMPNPLQASYYPGCAVPGDIKQLAKTKAGRANLLNPFLEWGNNGGLRSATVKGSFIMGPLRCGPEIKAKSDRFYPGGFEIDKGVGFHQCKLRWDERAKGIPVDVIRTSKGAVVFQGSSGQPKDGVEYASVIDLAQPVF